MGAGEKICPDCGLRIEWCKKGGVMSKVKLEIEVEEDILKQAYEDSPKRGLIFDAQQEIINRGRRAYREQVLNKISVGDWVYEEIENSKVVYRFPKELAGTPIIKRLKKLPPALQTALNEFVEGT